MRPPNEWPPANSGKCGTRLWASAAAERIVASDTRCGFRPFPPRSMYGNWYRKVAMPAAASALAMRSMFSCRMPAPAPCASVIIQAAPAGSSSSEETSPASSEARNEPATGAIASGFGVACALTSSPGMPACRVSFQAAETARPQGCRPGQARRPGSRHIPSRCPACPGLAAGRA